MAIHGLSTDMGAGYLSIALYAAKSERRTKGESEGANLLLSPVTFAARITRHFAVLRLRERRLQAYLFDVPHPRPRFLLQTLGGLVLLSCLSLNGW